MDAAQRRREWETLLQGPEAQRSKREAAVSARELRHRPILEWFSKTSRKAAALAGSPWAFALALAIVLVWAFTGPIFGFSDTWQLVINTGTTIVTFLMVFLIQTAQNRDTATLHLKLNELIASQKGASNHLIDAEDLNQEEIARLRAAFQILADEAERKDRMGTTSVEDVAPPAGEVKLPRRARRRGRSRSA
jgi:low affinity Fe/Cu permease